MSKIKNFFIAIGAWFKKILPSKRKLIQLYTALLFNANIKGFFNGRIYKGPVKNVCTPGLNCYSCPGASGACPLGSLQNSLSSTEHGSAYYVVGILLLYGIIFGRLICGWMCPFGLIQELLHKIKTPKLKKNAFTRVLSFLKYVILIFFVIIVPVAYAFRDFPLPAFCKYICPAGTLEGAIGLLTNEINSGELARLGPLFTWKFALLVSFVVGCIFVFRLFCRFICPLGALYGLFNRFSMLGIKLDRSKCVDCGKCLTTCQMDIKHVGDHECISCGDCVSVCPTEAISFKGGKIFLMENEIKPTTPDMTAEEIAAVEAENEANAKKTKRRQTIVKTVVGVLMAALLGGVIFYYNFVDKNVEPVKPPVGDDTTEGYDIGLNVPEIEIEIFDENGSTGDVFNTKENEGKVIVLNFWGVWCGPCKQELPDFDRIATEYLDNVVVVALHTVDYKSDAAGYVDKNFKDSDIIFGYDIPYEEDDSIDHWFTMFGGGDSYPMTVIIDENGIILELIYDTIHYDELKSIIDSALAD